MGYWRNPCFIYDWSHRVVNVNHAFHPHKVQFSQGINVIFNLSNVFAATIGLVAASVKWNFNIPKIVRKIVSSQISRWIRDVFRVKAVQKDVGRKFITYSYWSISKTILARFLLWFASWSFQHSWAGTITRNDGYVCSSICFQIFIRPRQLNYLKL